MYSIITIHYENACFRPKFGSRKHFLTESVRKIVENSMAEKTVKPIGKPVNPVENSIGIS